MLVNLSGRGDKDLAHAVQALADEGAAARNQPERAARGVGA